jgi:hypothetical protein
MFYLFTFNQLNFNFNPKQIYLSRSWSSQKISDDSQPNSKNLMRLPTSGAEQHLILHHSSAGYSVAIQP